jgi:hypothetical protein
MRRIFTRLLIIFVLIGIITYLAISKFSISELIYPPKIDSLYLHAQQITYDQEVAEGKAKPGKMFLYHPSQLGLATDIFSATTPDSIHLKGWYIADSTLFFGTTLILLPDINESKFNYIDIAAEFINRGIHVCLMDMRAQGESEGLQYSMGGNSVKDVSVIMDSLVAKYKTENIAVMGSGTATVIALQASLADNRVKVTVLQNPFLSLHDYLLNYTHEKYGRFNKLFYGTTHKTYERQTGIKVDSLNLKTLIGNLNTPTLFINSIFEDNFNLKPTEELFSASTAKIKNWMIFREQPDEKENVKKRKKFFDRIASFINSSMPKKTKKSKFRKLV